MEEKVSIIIPYYKSLKYISKSLKSVINQTYKNFEIILIYDDAIKYDLNIIKKKFSKIKNLKIYANKINLGVALSRNVGIKKARGKYIAFLDSDDYWKKNKLKIQINSMIKNSAEMSYTNYDILNKSGLKKAFFKNINSYDELKKRCNIGLSTVIIKSDLKRLGGFPELKTQEDFGLWLRYFRNNVKVLAINKSLSVWRDTPNSLSSNPIRKVFDAFSLFYKYENKNLLLSFYNVVILSINKIRSGL